MLVGFVIAAVAVLDNAFRNAARDAVRDRLTAQLYALLTVAEVDERGLIRMPEALAEPRFAIPRSGLYAFIYDQEGKLSWRSDSSISIDPPSPPAVEVGSLDSDRLQPRAGFEWFTVSFGLLWELERDRRVRYTFLLAEDVGSYRLEVAGFRGSLLLWIALAAALLFLLQILTLRWALRPLAAVTGEVQRVECGEQDVVTGNYPDEIDALTRNINALIRANRRALDRYRNSLGDLAHSLKTPLAVLRGLSEQSDPEKTRQALGEQTGRMAEIVDYQLKRAASPGSSVHVRRIQAAPAIRRVVNTVEKVYVDKGITFEVDVPADLELTVDEGDLMEMAGNLLDNACKWCRGRVGIRASRLGGIVRITVTDDGPGVDREMARVVVGRGVRADSQSPGQGIGLAVVSDIVSGYGGSLEIGEAAGGGACIGVDLPGR